LSLGYFKRSLGGQLSGSLIGGNADQMLYARVDSGNISVRAMSEVYQGTTQTVTGVLFFEEEK
jgi:hypothetical protein